MDRRSERINALLRDEISHVLLEDLKDPRISSLVSVTRVDVSSDLGFAKVYVSVMGVESEKRNTMKVLKSAARFVRKSLRDRVSLRALPTISFRLDDSIENDAEILRLINEGMISNHLSES